MAAPPADVQVLDARDEVRPGERSGPGLEGARCPACGTQFRVRIGPAQLRYRCTCGGEFGPADLACPAMEAETIAGGPPRTMLVHTGESRRPPPTLMKAEEPGAAPSKGDAGEGETGPPAVRFGKYEILGEVARGGMGVVYRARQAGLKREVALKMLLAGEGAGEEQVKRFLREAESAAKLSHPGIVPIYDVGVEEGKHYYAMEFVHGESVAQLLERMGAIPPRQALKIAHETALALQAAHDQGILHRDIKPGNILIAPREGKSTQDALRSRDSLVFSSGVSAEFRVVVTDFGLAKQMGGEEAITVSGTALGTPVYMPPEQADGDLKAMGPWSDVYSLGAVLYEMVTGKEPFQGASVGQVLSQVITRDPEPPRKAAPNLHRDVETIILKAMAKEPKRRYASAQALADDIERYLKGDPIAARPASFLYRAAKAIRRNKAATAAVVLVTLAAAAAAGFYTLQSARRARRTLDEADRMVERGRARLADKEYLEAEKEFAGALALLPGHVPAREALAGAKLTRLLDHAEELLADKDFRAAGLVLAEARNAAPEHPDVRRLSRVQAGTAVLEVASDAPGLEAFFVPGDEGVFWLPAVLPPLPALRKARIAEALGRLPFGPADRPPGDGWLLLFRGAALEDVLFVPVPRGASVAVRRKALRVDPASPGALRTIGAALAAAGPGTVIEVAAGVYPEALRIEVPHLTLRATRGARPQIGDPASGPTISGKDAPGFRLKGFSIRCGKESAVRLDRCAGASIEDNEIAGGEDSPVYLVDCPGSWVAGNEIRDSRGSGVQLLRCAGSAVAGNRAYRLGEAGVAVQASASVAAGGNLLQENAELGFYADHAEGLEVTENVCRRNGRGGFVAGTGCGDVLIRQNFASDSLSPAQGGQAFGFQCSGCTGVVVRNTSLRNGFGMALFGGLDCLDNLLVDNQMGLWIQSTRVTDYNVFWGNRILGQVDERQVQTLKELQEMHAWSETQRRMLHGLVADPRFADPANDDFRLAADSPCRGAASDRGDIGADWARLSKVIAGSFDGTGWLRGRNVRRLEALALAAEEKQEFGEAARRIRAALAYEPENAALAEKLKVLEARDSKALQDR